MYGTFVSLLLALVHIWHETRRKSSCTGHRECFTPRGSARPMTSSEDGCVNTFGWLASPISIRSPEVNHCFFVNLFNGCVLTRFALSPPASGLSDSTSSLIHRRGG
ncbi:unnamed protein product, partial [Ectocarpus sp. 12 AP-2014]